MHPTASPAQPEPATSLSSAYPEVAFLGRSLAEYRAFLDLAERDLDGRSVLDVAAGPASFAAEATRLGAAVTAVDPLYDRPVATLANLGKAGLNLTAAALSQTPAAFNLDGEPATASLLAAREQSIRLFLRDYAGGRAAGRYRAARLPQLPFRNGVFDLVTCAHFLFLYGDRLPFEFHVEACRELARVARTEVRLYPLVTLAGIPYPDLDRLLARLHHVGLTSEIRPVSHQVLRGATDMLILRRTLR